jgi:predicted transcriptional regulator
LNCTHAVICEEYSGTSKRIVFEGCWKIDSVKTPVDRNTCDKFEENTDRVKRSYWQKWEGRIFIAGGPHSEERVNYDSFKTADDFLAAEEESHTEELQICEEHDCTPQDYELAADEKQKLKESQTLRNLPTIDELPTIEKLPTIDELPIEEHGTAEEKLATRECEVTPEYEHDPRKHKETSTNTAPDTDNVWKKITTRSLILKALTYNISRLSEIAEYADVDPSTAHYHLRNLISQGRVMKVSRGVYKFSDGQSLKNSDPVFDSFLKNGSQLGRESSEGITLNPIEKSILMEILSKENKYEQFSGRKLAKKCSISRNTVRKYTLELEKKKLIKIKREGKQYIYIPTKVAIHGLTAFFNSFETGSKSDSESSKSEPVCEPFKNGSDQVTGADLDMHDADNEPIVNPDPGIFETFEESLCWQQKNAHRFIIQFKLLRCSHPRLKGTGWIFGKKSIRKHFAEAYIFKSKDPTREIINVLPKDPFIFTSEIDFHTKIINFVNEVIERLRDYGVVLDLSEPVEIRMQHEAVEDDLFARKVIERGLLFFKSKIKTIDSTGEPMEYVIAIDKSKKLHFEFEGREAHILTANLEAFVDDVITGRIDRKVLREMPQRLENVQNLIQHEFGGIEQKLERDIQRIQNTQTLLHQNQLDSSQNLISYKEMVQTINDAAGSIKQAADTIKQAAKTLYDTMSNYAIPQNQDTRIIKEMEAA